MKLCIKILMLLTSASKVKGWKTYIESVKVKIETEDIYLYPDIVVTKPQEAGLTTTDKYIIHNLF
jgi:hypothetical protein